MSATTTRGQEEEGFVAGTLRRPIQEAVREGVLEAFREQRVVVRERERDRSEDEGGSNWGRYVILALVGLGLAAFVMRRRGDDSGGGGSRGQRTSEIRERSKTSTTHTGSDVGGQEHTERAEERMEEEESAEGATPGAESESG